MTKRKKFGISKTLTNSLSQTVKVASNNMGVLRHEIVPIDLIELDPCNPRTFLIQKDDIISGLEHNDYLYDKKRREIDSLESLKNSIIKQGILNPVWIYKYKTHYRLIMGERRVLASLLAGNSDIHAKVLESRPLDTSLRLLQWMENLERSDLTLWERITNINLIIEAQQKETPDLKVNATFIKNLLGCSLPHAMNYFAVVFCSQDLRDSIQGGKINNLEKAALLANINDKDVFKEVYTLCISGASLKHLQAMIRTKKLKSHTNSVLRGNVSKGANFKTINLGFCKSSDVIKKITDILLKDNLCAEHANCFENLDWRNNSEISKAFKSFIAKLEVQK